MLDEIIDLTPDYHDPDAYKGWYESFAEKPGCSNLVTQIKDQKELIESVRGSCLKRFHDAS